VESRALSADEESVLAASERGSLVERLTTPRRLFLALGIIVFVTFAAQIREVANHEGAFYRGGDVPVGSDFFVFYSAGQIAASGDGDQLYDLDRQRSEQARTLETDAFDGFLPFAYPAFVAVPYSLLAQVPFLWAYAISTLILLMATGATVWRLRSCSPTVSNQPLLVALAVFASQPLTATNFGGLATAFSLLCFAGFYALMRRGHQAIAGVWLGLLFYKPQLVLPMLLLILWRRQWRVAGIASLVGFALGLLGVVIAGPNWPRNFLDLARGEFYTNEAQASGDRMISLLGCAEQIFGLKSVWAHLIAGLFGAVLVGLLLIAWRNARPAGSQFPLQFGLAIAVTLIVSPHALFYEAALLILPIIFLIDSWRGETTRQSISPNQRLVLICLFASGYLWSLGPLLGFQLLAAVPVILAVMMWHELGLRLQLDQASDPWRFPLRVSWGESPNAPSGKRS